MYFHLPTAFQVRFLFFIYILNGSFYPFLEENK